MGDDGTSDIMNHAADNADNRDNQVISDIMQLDSVSATHHPQAFVNSLSRIFQYAANTIEERLNRVEKNTLDEVHKLLCEAVVTKYEQFKDKRIVNRKKKYLVMADIMVLGHSVIGTSPHRDLDKIFKEPQGPIDFDPNEDRGQSIADLMELVATLSTRLQKVEAEMVELKRTISDQESVREQQGVLINVQNLVPNSQHSTNELSDNGDVTSDDDDENGVPGDTALLDNNLLSRVATSQTPRPMPSQTGGSKNSQSPTQSTQSDAQKQTQIASSTISSNHERPSRIKPAKTRAAPRKTTKVYIGGVSGSTTMENIKEELVELHISRNDIKVQLLSDNDDWRSFSVIIPEENSVRVLDQSNWAQGIKVRPFREERPKQDRGNNKSSPPRGNTNNYPREQYNSRYRDDNYRDPPSNERSYRDDRPDNKPPQRYSDDRDSSSRDYRPDNGPPQRYRVYSHFAPSHFAPSHFAPSHSAPSQFVPFPFRPFPISPLFHFAPVPFRPLPDSPLIPTSPLPISPFPIRPFPFRPFPLIPISPLPNFFIRSFPCARG